MSGSDLAICTKCGEERPWARFAIGFKLSSGIAQVFVCQRCRTPRGKMHGRTRDSARKKVEAALSGLGK